ncbi:MAG: hypothetical protein MJK12_20140 [Colwellia sp.]|nr:hypothetical protein [Colwellia sp.]
MKKIQLASIVSLSIVLFACGGSGSEPTVGGTGGSNVNTSKEAFIKSISETSWLRECFYINNLKSAREYYFIINIRINSSLESITTAEMFDESDCNHHSLGTIIKFTTQLEITNKITSEESIEVYGLNTSFIEGPDFIDFHGHNLESPDITELYPPYSLIYLDNEKLYYGIGSGSNNGKSKETRHSSISLDDYFRQVLY